MKKKTAGVKDSSSSYSGDNALAHYYSDMGNFELLGKERETTLFREIETAEHAFIIHMLIDEELFNSLLILSDELEAEKAVDNNYKKAVKNFILGDRSETCTKKLVRAIRFTESGQTWFDSKLRKIPNGNPKIWKSKASSLEKEYVDLKNYFIAANLRLVVMLAKKNMRSWLNMTMGDLIQEGNMGLIKAVDRFDIDKGYRFATYAMWWIRHYIKRSIVEKDSIIRIPVHVNETVSIINSLDNKNIAITGTGMSDDEIISATGLIESKVRMAILHRKGNRVLSLDSPFGEEGDDPWVEYISDPNCENPEAAVNASKMNTEIRSLLTCLTPMQSSVIKLRFGLDGGPHTLEEIGSKFSLTRERIRQIEAVALRKLRNRSRAIQFADDMFFENTG